MAAEEIVHRGAEKNDGRYDGGEDDLPGEDAVDLADEPPSELVLTRAQTRIQGLPSLQVHLILGAHSLEPVHLRIFL